jgi:PKD repeat protein
MNLLKNKPMKTNFHLSKKICFASFLAVLLTVSVNLKSFSQQGCQAMYSWYPDTSVSATSIQFTDQSTTTGTIISWNWDFGDGTTSILQNPLHTYSAPGLYWACLTIVATTFNGQCTSSMCDTIYVANSACSAWYTFMVSGSNVTFTGNATGTAPISYLWTFGDGTTSTMQNPVHTYSSPGTYNACLIIADAAGCNAMYCNNVTLQGTGCQANFSWSNIPPSTVVSFTDLSISTGLITNWFWNFGDGTTSNQQNPVHTYNSAGAYTVCLTILGPGCQSTFCDSVFAGININCNAYFVSTQPSACQFYFWNQSTGNIFSYFWSFGDGSTSALQNPSHTYSAAGSYNVCLTITDSAQSCMDTFCTTVSCVLSGGCNAGFIAYPDSNSQFSGLIHFFDTTQGTILSWFWDFGDSTTSTLQNPSHIYADSGWYYVCLTVTCPGPQPGTVITSTTCDSVYSNKILSGFGHISQELEIQVYPNPVKENLTVKFILHSPSDIKICVNSLIGTKVAEVKTGESVMKKKIQVTR